MDSYFCSWWKNKKAYYPNKKISVYEAVLLQNYQDVAEIINREPWSVNDYYVNFQTPLLAVYDHVDLDNPVPPDHMVPIMNLLIERGADVNGQGDCGVTPLLRAVQARHVQGVKLLLENQADPNIRYRETSILFEAMRKTANDLGSESIVRLLLQHGATPTANDTLTNVNFDVWNSLQEAGYRIKVHCVFLQLVRACRALNKQLARYVLAHGEDIDAAAEFSLKSMSYYIKFYFDRLDAATVNFIEKLLEYFSLGRVTHENENITELHVAAEKSSAPRVRELLAAGADVNARNVYGDTALHTLFQELRHCGVCLMEVTRLLVEAGADTRARNKLGYTPFNMAARLVTRSGLAEALTFMLAKASGVESLPLIDKHSVRPCQEPDKYLVDGKLCELQLAILLGLAEVVDRLIDLGYSQEAKPWLFYAVKNVNYVVAKTLLEAGCLDDRNFFLLHFEDPGPVHLRMAALLWSFGGTSILRALLTNNLCKIRDNNWFPDKLCFLLICCYAVDLRANKLSRELIPVRGIFKQNPWLESFLNFFNANLDELKKIKAWCGVSHFDILSKDLDCLVRLMSSKTKFKACVNLLLSLVSSDHKVNYDYLLIERITLVIEKKALFDWASNFLNTIWTKNLRKSNYNDLPDKVTWTIFSNFSVRELKKFRSTFSGN